MFVIVARELVGGWKESFWARWAKEELASLTAGAGIVGGIAQCSLSICLWRFGFWYVAYTLRGRKGCGRRDIVTKRG